MTGTGAVASSAVPRTAIGCIALSTGGKSSPTTPALTQLDRLFQLADSALAAAAAARTDTKTVCANQTKIATAVRQMPAARSFDDLNTDFGTVINALAQWYTSVRSLLLTPATPAAGSSSAGACLDSVCLPSVTINIGGAPDPSQLGLEVEQLTAPVTEATRGILRTVGSVAHASFNLPAHVVALMPVDLPVGIPTLSQSERGPGPADDTQIMANATDNVGSAGTASLQRDKYTCDQFPFDYASVDNFGRPGPHDTQGDVQNSTVRGYADGAAYLIHDYTESGDGAGFGNTESQDADAQVGFGATFVGGTPSTNFLSDIQVTMPTYWAGDAHAGSNTPLGSGYVPYLGKIIGSFAGKSTSTVKVNITADMYNDSAMLTSYPILDPPELVGDNGTGGNSMNYYGSFTYKALIPFSGSPHAFASVLHYHAHLTDSPSTATDVLADANFTNRDIIGQINTGMIRWHFVLSPGVHGWVNCNA